jgi:hypothetical protein
MTCKNAQNQIILFLYDELEEREKKRLMRHIESCASCQESFEEISRFFESLGGGKETEWAGRRDDCWRHIIERVGNEKPKNRFSLPALKWRFAFGGFALFLILGIFIGRFLFFDSGFPVKEISTNGGTQDRAVLNQYLEDMKPLMLDLSNTSISGYQNGKIPGEKEIIRSMLAQTRLLRSRLSNQNDPYLNSLLVDIELILMEVDNTVPGDRVMMKSVQEMIHNKDIPIKIDLFQQKVRKIGKI